MYFICKFSDTWTLYDKIKGSSRLLAPPEIEFLTSLFPTLVGHNSNILEALQVSTISLGKLQQLTVAAKPATGAKKPLEPSAKS
jgi:hypothetical protein